MQVGFGCYRRASRWPKVTLNNVPKKYDGLDGTELAISESQERVAVVVAASDADKFKLAEYRGDDSSDGDETPHDELQRSAATVQPIYQGIPTDTSTGAEKKLMSWIEGARRFDKEYRISKE